MLVFYLIIFYAVWIYGLLYVASVYTRTSIPQVLSTFTNSSRNKQEQEPVDEENNNNNQHTDEKQNTPTPITNMIQILKSPPTSLSPKSIVITVQSPTHSNKSNSSSSDDDFIKL